MSESLILDIDVKPLKQQLRDATKDLQLFRQKFGETSTEAVNAAKKVAAIKDALQGANEAAQLFDPGSRFQALTNAASTAAGGISAVQGAMALFGTESENVAKTLQKVQGAMALSQGLSQLKDIGKVGEQLKLTFGGLTAGMSNFKKALISTGVGALVAGLGLLIANFDKVKETINNLFPGLAKFGNYISDLTQKFTDFIGVTSKADRELETFRKNNKLRNEQLERDIALLTAQGGKESEIAKIRKQIAQNELEEIAKNADKKGKLYGEDAKKYKETKNQLAIIDAEEAKRLKEADKKKDEERKAAEEKRKAAEEKENERLKKAAEDRKAFDEFEVKRQQDAQKYIDEAAEKEIERKEKSAADSKAYNDFDTQLQLDLLKVEEDATAKKIALTDAELQAKLAFANALSGVFSGLSGLFEKGTTAAKIAGLAEIAIGTGVGYIQGLDIAQKGAKATGPAAPFAFPIFYATQIAAVLGAAAKAKTIMTQVKGGGGAGPTISAPTFASAPSVASPIPTLGTSPVTAIATLGNQNQKPIRAYVVESEVTATQRRVSDIERRAGF